MKNRPTFLALLSLLLFSLQLHAQTKIIAHKSHSGKPSTFNINSSTHNFGEPGPRFVTDTVIHVSDSVFIAIMHTEYSMYKDYQGNRLIDTIRYSEVNNHFYLHNIYLGKPLKQLKEEMPHTVFIGFEQQEAPPQNHYFYPHFPNKNSKLDKFHLPKVPQNKNGQLPVKKN